MYFGNSLWPIFSFYSMRNIAGQAVIHSQSGKSKVAKQAQDALTWLAANVDPSSYTVETYRCEWDLVDGRSAEENANVVARYGCQPVWICYVAVSFRDEAAEWDFGDTFRGILF